MFRNFGLISTVESEDVCDEVIEGEETGNAETDDAADEDTDLGI